MIEMLPAKLWESQQNQNSNKNGRKCKNLSIVFEMDESKSEPWEKGRLENNEKSRK